MITPADNLRIDQYISAHHLQGPTPRADLVKLVNATHEQWTEERTHMQDELALLRASDEDLSDSNVALRRENELLLKDKSH